MRHGILAGGLAAAALAALAPMAMMAQPFDAFEPFDPFEPQQSQTKVVRIGAVSGSFLGVGIQEVDAERAKALKLKEEAGVEITKVEDDSPAAKAGLKVGDVVLQYNGQRIEGMKQFSRFVGETPAGRDAKLLISRDGQTQTVVARIAERKGMVMPSVAFPRMEMPEMPDLPRSFMMWRSSRLGIEGEALKGQLAEYFGAKEGVLVRSVMKDTPAEKAGLKAGDVIVKVNDSKVTSPAEIGSALRNAKSGSSSVPIVVLRERKEITLTAAVENDKSGWDGNSPAIRISGRGVRM